MVDSIINQSHGIHNRQQINKLNDKAIKNFQTTVLKIWHQAERKTYTHDEKILMIWLSRLIALLPKAFDHSVHYINQLFLKG